MEVLNKVKLALTSLDFTIKGPEGKPLTTTDDIAVEVLTGSRGGYSGYKSLTEVLTDLIQVVKGTLTGEDTTEAIDSLYEVYNFLTEYKNSDILQETEEVSEESINSLFAVKEDKLETKD